MDCKPEDMIGTLARITSKVKERVVVGGEFDLGIRCFNYLFQEAFGTKNYVQSSDI